MTNEARMSLDEVTAESAGQAAERFVAAWNSHDPEQLVNLCRPDVQWEDPGIEGGHLSDVENLRKWLADTYIAFPDLTFSKESPLFLAADGRSFAQEWHADATMCGPYLGMEATQQAISFSGVDIHAYRGGSLSSVRTIYNQMPVAVQMAAAPEPGSALDHLGKRMQHLAAHHMRKHPSQ